MYTGEQLLKPKQYNKTMKPKRFLSRNRSYQNAAFLDFTVFEKSKGSKDIGGSTNC
jgi:hypothetical protein